MSENACDITVSIVNWNTRDELRECLLTVINQNKSVSFEIIVVDNASSDGSVGMLQSEFKDQVKIIANSNNLGFGAAHNQAIRQSKGRYVFLLNPDSRLIDDNLLASMCKFMDKNLNIGILGPRILNPDGSLQYSARRNPTAMAAIFRHTLLGKIFPNNRFVKEYLMADWAHDKARDVDWLSGAAILMRKDMLGSIGLLDEGFFMYCEDVDICKRARDAGWRVVYYPEVSLTHRIGAASDLNPITMIKQHHKSMLRYFLKYNSRSLKVLLTPLVMIGLFFRCRSLIKKLNKPD